jgi:tetratricopeptide (TPR) repeat protein
MTDEADPAEVCGLIAADFRSQLTGDIQHDWDLLHEFGNRYRQHPLYQEILRELGRIYFKNLPEDVRARLDAKDVDALFYPGLAEAEGQLRSGDAEGARRTLERVIDRFDMPFNDDAVSEYRILPNPYDAALYRKLFPTKREVRDLPYDLSLLHFRYGETLVELGELDAAENTLRRARSFNPINPPAIFELAEVFKLQQRWREFHEISTFGLLVSFRIEHAARAYRNLGFYYIETGDYELAAACYQKSYWIDAQSKDRCALELAYIEQKIGRPVPPADHDVVDETLQANGIQTSLSEVVREAIAEVDSPDPTEKDIAETVRIGMRAANTSNGRPEQLAALMLSCAGQYRFHPKTPEVVRRMAWAWASASQAPPDSLAKLSLAVVRLAEGETVSADGSTSAGLSFVDDLHLWTTQPGLEGTVAATHIETGLVVAHYDFADKSLIINSELEGSDFPKQSITDAISLVWIYVGELTHAESQKMPGTT